MTPTGPVSDETTADDTTPEVYPQGLFTWADVAVLDPAAGTQFYTELFGWDAEDHTGAEGEYVYTMFTLGGKPVAGLGGMPPEMSQAGVPPMWNSYVTVDNVDSAAARVQASGGTVLDVVDIPDTGRMAIVMDPTGAAVMLWQGGQHRGAEIFTGHAAMSWNELATRDVSKAQAFYTDVLGWRYEESPGPFPYHLIMMDTKSEGNPYMFDTFNGGMLTMDDNWPAEIPAHWMVYFTVDNTDDLVARVDDLGGKVSVPPFDTPNGRISVINDPQGATFSVIAPSQAVAPEEV